MTPEEKFDAAFEAADRDREAFARFLDQFSETQVRWSPPDGEWSILLGLEHCLIVERHFHRTFVEACEEAEKSGNWNTLPDPRQTLTTDQLRRREQGRIIAPDFLEPKGRDDFEAMKAELWPTRLAMHESLQPYRSIDLSRLLVHHRYYGDMNAYERIEYAGIHDALHHEQMTRVVKAPGFPAA